MPPPRLQKIRKRMVVPPSIRVLRSHAGLAKSAAGLAAALLAIHWLEMHLISIQGFDCNVLYFDQSFENAFILQSKTAPNTLQQPDPKITAQDPCDCTLPRRTTPAIPGAREAVPALRIARHRPIDLTCSARVRACG